MSIRKPKVSRKPLVLIVAFCLVLSGVLIPVGAHLPRFIEAEIVLAVWWVVWTGVLAWLLFQGHAVDDDSQWLEFGGNKSQAFLNVLGFGGDFGLSLGCGEGCAYAALALIAFVLVGLALMLVVEFLIPAIALLLLASIGGMLARAVNDTHDCQGRFGMSLLWGALWSTVYIGPLVVLVLGVSTMLAHRA